MFNYLEEINTYIESNLEETVHPGKALENLENLFDFFSDNNIPFDIKFLEKLIKSNNLLFSLIETVYESDYASELGTNNFFRNLKDGYLDIKLTLKNVEDDSYDFDNSGVMTSDSMDSYLYNVRKKKLLTEEEEKNLAQEIAEGNKEAWKKFVEANLPLVISIAKKYVGYGLPFSDLISEGNIGLMEAASRFDYTKGYKFSTYATPAIKNSIQNAVYKQSRIIRVPWHRIRKYRDYEKGREKFILELGREPKISELASLLDMKEEEILNLQKEITNLNPLSLDLTLTDEEDMALGDCLGVQESGYEKIDASQIDFQKIMKILRLTPKQQIFFEKHYLKGIYKAEIARELGCTRAYIDIIEKGVLKKIDDKRDKILSYFGVQGQKTIGKRVTYKIPSFYKLFKVDKEIIDYIIVKKLEPYFQYVIYLGWGLDLENPVRDNEYYDNKKDYFRKTISPKIKEEILKIKTQLESTNDNKWLTEGIDVRKTLKNARDSKEEILQNRRKKTFYERIGIEKSIIDYIIVKELDDYDKYVIYLAYGSELGYLEPKTNYCSKRNYFNTVLIPKIKEKAIQIQEKIDNSKENVNWLTANINVKESLEIMEYYNPNTPENKNEGEEDLYLAIKKHRKILSDRMLKKRIIASQQEILSLKKIVFNELKNEEFISLLYGFKPEQIFIFILMGGVKFKEEVNQIATWMNLSVKEVLKISQEFLSTNTYQIDIIKKFINVICNKYNSEKENMSLKKTKK